MTIFQAFDYKALNDRNFICTYMRKLKYHQLKHVKTFSDIK